jgi:hypothetical protein
VAAPFAGGALSPTVSLIGTLMTLDLAHAPLSPRVECFQLAEESRSLAGERPP